MSSQYKRFNLFIMRKLKVLEKRTKKLVILKLLLRNLSNYLIKNYQIYQHFHRKEKKRPKRLTKYQILRNVLPLFDDVGILRREYAFRNYAGTYEVEVMDSKSLDDSLFLAKKELIIFSENYQKKKKELNKFYQQELLLKNGMMQLILMILIQFIVILIQQK